MGTDCEFIPGASLGESPSTDIGGKLFISTVVSLLALAGAGTRRYVLSKFFFSMNFSFESSAPRERVRHGSNMDTTRVRFISVRISPLAITSDYSNYLNAYWNGWRKRRWWKLNKHGIFRFTSFRPKYRWIAINWLFWPQLTPNPKYVTNTFYSSESCKILYENLAIVYACS